MYDPVNSTRPFVPQLNFSHSGQTGSSRVTDNTRYTSFSTIYSSQDHTLNSARGSATATRPARTRAGDRADTDGSYRFATSASPPPMFSTATGTAPRWGADRYVSISPLRYRHGGDWRAHTKGHHDRGAASDRTGADWSAGRASPWRRRGATERDEGYDGHRSGIVYSKERYDSRRPRRGVHKPRGASPSSSPSRSDSYSESGSSSSSSSSFSNSDTSLRDTDDGRRRRRRQRRRHSREDAKNADGDHSDDSSAQYRLFDENTLAADVDFDAQPVIPPEMLQRSQQALFQWNRHPQHPVVLSLLQSRGIYLPRYRELIGYHMSELFLHYLGICSGGSYFVYYAPGKWPKERFFRLRMMPRDRRTSSQSELIPYLSWTMHQTGVQVIDSVPLEQLVGITATPRAASFRPFLVSPETIIGCREGRGHRARLPVDGAFSLWFYDGRTNAARSLDLLTCDSKVYDVWTKCFRGVVSVNSSSVVQTPLTSTGMSVTMAQLMHIAQKANEELMAQMNPT